MPVLNEQLRQKFEQEYQRLNEQQQRAVNTLEGPVMVIAGPGTGKTQILASRIGKILLETDAQPQNILCLTYTDAGVVAMRKRLLQFIGPDAYKVNLYTFHAFCNDVIQDNMNLFEKSSLDPISDLERIELFKSLIDSLPKNHPLKRYRGDVYFDIGNLQQLFSTMKREGWTPAHINQCIDAYLADLPSRDEFIYKRKYKEFNPGDVKTDKIAEETERMNRLRAAVNEFDRFQDLMRRKNRYDFDDMINWVIRAFESNSNLLAGYQEKFQYILVDEYQDTSGTQNRLVELLISYWDKPNVFVVGDDDQSIYRFQGANVENMLQFAQQYTNDLLTVVLTRNYRSTQPILDSSKTLISRNNERLVQQLPSLSKELIASNDKIRQLRHTPVIREYESQRQEMIGIVKHIETLLAQGVAPGRIGIIYKENKYGEELTRYCKLRNLTVYSKRQLNALELPLAQKLISILQYIASELFIPYSGDELLFELLHFDWFAVPPIEIAKLSIEADEIKRKNSQFSLRRLLVEKAHQPPKDLFSQGLNPSLVKASALLESWIGEAPNTTLQQLFESIIRESGCLSAILRNNDKHWQLSILNSLFDFIKEETRRKPLMGIAELVNLLEVMMKEELPLPIVQVSGSDKGINLLTAHGSKGLEYEYVFLAGCNAAFWEKKRKPASGFRLPDTVIGSSGGSDEEELRRLFYVAITRAEQHLYISYSRFRNDGKEMEPSMFIAEIQAGQALPVERLVLDTDVLSEFSVLDFATPQAPEIEALEEAFLAPILDRFTMNVTALNNYLHCPLEFYYRNLVRIPSPKNEATEFGSAVHYALEKLFRKMSDHPQKEFPSKEIFIEDFAWYMNRHRESFTREQYNRRLEHGQEILSNYYEQYIGGFSKIVSIELNVKNVLLNGIPLKGKLDKLEFDGKNVNIVDYKTGDPEKALPKLKGPSEKEPNGGDYWRQAVFYKILIDHFESRDWKAVSTEFDFVEPDKKKKYRREKILISPADITTVSQQIKQTWEKIQNREFYTGCGKEDCHWCSFVKTNNLAVQWHEIDPNEEATEA
jgi:DNA helicase-2/ATP-dependent DNA helicase PcrA